MYRGHWAARGRRARRGGEYRRDVPGWMGPTPVAANLEPELRADIAAAHAPGSCTLNVGAHGIAVALREYAPRAAPTPS